MSKTKTVARIHVQGYKHDIVIDEMIEESGEKLYVVFSPKKVEETCSIDRAFAIASGYAKEYIKE